jgi:RNA polymerase sigma-70 factor (sigma-E family)
MSEPPDHSGDWPPPDDRGFREWMAVRAPALRRKAFLLAGDWHTADDLVQDSLVAVYAGWGRIARGRNVDAYANRVLVHKFIDDRRRPWRRERLVDAVPDVPDERAETAFAEVDGRDGLLRSALASLPAGQRAVLVLRYTDDLAVEEIAYLMDLPSGTVKSRLSRGSEAVRRHLEQRGHPMALAVATNHSPAAVEDPS